MHVSVIMPAHNAARYIGDALTSLLRQRDAAQLDIIVIDDGSTDGTAAIVTEFAIGAPEVRLVGVSHGGIAKARNRGIAELAPNAELVTMLDADDLSPAGRFARDIEAFASDPELDFLYGQARMFYETGDDPLIPIAPYHDFRGVQLGASLMRLDLLRRLGPFDESLKIGEDTDMLFRLFDLRPRMKLIDLPCVYYRRHDANITRDSAAVLETLQRVVMARLRRKRAGAEVAPLPAGFFDGMEAIKPADWLRKPQVAGVPEQ
ncbi:MAG: glycosyltransferase family A protein [Devosia sp.]